ncbi:hypothetical protein BH11MYX1_BH11MYX1_55430 [soil metagenome]
MNHKALIFILGAATSACVVASSSHEFDPSGSQAKPTPESKTDSPSACGASACLPELCGYDCATSEGACSHACASQDDRAAAFVTGRVTGGEQTSFDSRGNPFAPFFSLDNVLVYCCEIWDFEDSSSAAHDGLEVKFEELVHSSLVDDPTDPTRRARDLDLYIGHFSGPGSYKAEAFYTSGTAATWYQTNDACTVDVAASADRGLTGTYRCSIHSQANTVVSVEGTFGCPSTALAGPNFSRWVH